MLVGVEAGRRTTAVSEFDRKDVRAITPPDVWINVIGFLYGSQHIITEKEKEVKRRRRVCTVNLQ
jgi:hypothetical protein